MKTEIITCINCPVGCRMEVTHEGEEVLSVKGNTCKRGDAYARQPVEWDAMNFAQQDYYTSQISGPDYAGSW